MSSPRLMRPATASSRQLVAPLIAASNEGASVAASGKSGKVTRWNPAESCSTLAGYSKCGPIFGYLRSRRLKPRSASIFPISPGPHNLAAIFDDSETTAIVERTMTSLPTRPVESHLYAARRAECLYSAGELGRRHSQRFG